MGEAVGFEGPAAGSRAPAEVVLAARNGAQPLLRGRGRTVKKETIAAPVETPGCPGRRLKVEGPL